MEIKLIVIQDRLSMHAMRTDWSKPWHWVQVQI